MSSPFDPAWLQVKTDAAVPAKPEGGFWTLVLPFVNANTLVRIEAKLEDTWNYGPEMACRADGVPSSYVSTKSCLNGEAPVGALIAKVGGSTADNVGASRHVVGHHAVFLVGASERGPLYLTLNDARTGFDDNSGQIRVNIWLAQMPEASAGG